MLCEIAAASAHFAALPPHIGSPLRARILRLQAVAFVLSSNRLEQVGTQGEEETRALCESATDEPPDLELKSRETVQTLLGLQCAHRLVGEMRAAVVADGTPPHHALLLSPGIQCQIHAELMRGLVAQPGSYRTAEAYPYGCSFFYAPPETIESRQLVWTDAFNDLVAALPAVTLPDAFRLAALALFHSVQVHPFSDGNGRLCRILASAVLSEHHFFPLCLQPLTALTLSEDNSQHMAWRGIFIGALEACRKDAAHCPADLTALLIESSWAAWMRVQGLVAECVNAQDAPCE
jgi:fido (protein-threonine AMPylation protein)